MGLSENDLELLQDVCGTFIRPVTVKDEDTFYWDAKISDIDFRTKITEALSKVPPSELKDLSKLLNILYTPKLGVTWGGPLKPFSKLTLEQKEKVFQKWGKSNVAELRKAFNVLRKLSTFIFYSASTEEIGDIQEKIGYTHPDEVKTQSCSNIETQTASVNEVITTDYLVIGSGAGGGLAVGMLAEAGKEVVLLEKGGYIPEKELSLNEGEMISKQYDRGGALATKDAGVTIFAGSCLGGGTSVNWNGCFNTPEYIRNEWATEFGLTELASSSFEESLVYVNEMLNVNKDNSKHNKQNQALWDGAEKLGHSPKVIARNVKGCNEHETKNCGYCGMGCKSGCKQGTVRTSIQSGFDDGAKIYCNSEAYKLLFNGTKVVGASVTQTIDGVKTRFTVKANNVIVSCGAIHTPALLLRSGLKHKELGKNLNFHPTVGVAGVYNEEKSPWHGAMMTTLVSDNLRLEDNFGYWIETPPVHLGILSMTIPWISALEHKEDMLRVKNAAAFIVLTRDKFGGSVGIDKKGHAKVKYKLNPYDLKHMLAGMQDAANIHLAAGAKEVWFPHRTKKCLTPEMSETEKEKFFKTMTTWRWRPNDYILYSAHQMSTCRMGTDPKKSPVDPNGKFVGIDNLYVVDGSALPSCPGINPMISIMALSHMTIKKIING